MNRMIQIYYTFNRIETIMQPGEKLEIDITPLLNIDSKYGNWLIHPCVRYIPEGFAGYKWWMVCTPYPQYNSHYENPILFRGDGNSEKIPKRWSFVNIVQPPHEKGYNADSNLYFDGKKLWIIWKEASTNNTNSLHGNKAILGRSYDGKSFSRPQIICENIDDTNMYLASPVLMKIGEQLKMYTVFTPNSYRPIPNILKGPRHMAIFSIEQEDETRWNNKFEGVYFQNYPRKFDFWHIDLFEYNHKLYCLVTPEQANQVLLGESKDGIHFNFYSKPLLHAYGKKQTPYTYKVSGVVICDTFFLIYPMREIKNNQVNLYVTSMNFNELINKLKE